MVITTGYRENDRRVELVVSRLHVIHLLRYIDSASYQRNIIAYFSNHWARKGNLGCTAKTTYLIDWLELIVKTSYWAKLYVTYHYDIYASDRQAQGYLRVNTVWYEAILSRNHPSPNNLLKSSSPKDIPRLRKYQTKNTPLVKQIQNWKCTTLFDRAISWSNPLFCRGGLWGTFPKTNLERGRGISIFLEVSTFWWGSYVSREDLGRIFVCLWSREGGGICKKYREW